MFSVLLFKQPNNDTINLWNTIYDVVSYWSYANAQSRSFSKGDTQNSCCEM